jgi:chromate reductase
MKILAISGSSSKKSANEALLQKIKDTFSPEYHFDIVADLPFFALFSTDRLIEGTPQNIAKFKEKITAADAVIISTPEYTHNIPAILKNALEWITASGELKDKKVLAITFTPNEPRGEWAMKSLLFSLTTMQTKVVAQLPLYKTDFLFSSDTIHFSDENIQLIAAALDLLKG